MHALDASEMQHLPAFRNFVILAVIIASSVALADEDAKFIYEVCMHGMTTQPSMPRSESETFCFCTADEVKKSITPKQRSSIRDARNRMQSGQTVSQEVFIKSGLKMLVETSQEYCMGIQYPEPEKISAIEHKKYSSLANKSVREFNSLLNVLNCIQY